MFTALVAMLLSWMFDNSRILAPFTELFAWYLACAAERSDIFLPKAINSLWTSLAGSSVAAKTSSSPLPSLLPFLLFFFLFLGGARMILFSSGRTVSASDFTSLVKASSFLES